MWQSCQTRHICILGDTTDLPPPRQWYWNYAAVYLGRLPENRSSHVKQMLDVLSCNLHVQLMQCHGKSSSLTSGINQYNFPTPTLGQSSPGYCQALGKHGNKLFKQHYHLANNWLSPYLCALGNTIALPATDGTTTWAKKHCTGKPQKVGCITVFCCIAGNNKCSQHRPTPRHGTQGQQITSGLGDRARSTTLPQQTRLTEHRPRRSSGWLPRPTLTDRIFSQLVNDSTTDRRCGSAEDGSHKSL